MIIRRFFTIIIISGVFFPGCMLLTGKVNLNIPDQAPMAKYPSSVNIPGTRILIIPPKGYPLMESLGRLEKDPDNYIEVDETGSSSFYKRKSHIDEVISLAKSRGLKLYYEKEFNFGPYRAYLVFGPENNPDRDQMVMILGNDDFVATVSGVFMKGDHSARNATLKSILSAFVDTSIRPNLSLFARYTLNLSGTTFRYCAHSAKSYYYTPGGIGNPQSDLGMTQILVTEFPAMDKKAIHNFSITKLDNYRQAGFIIKSQSLKDTSVGGLFASQVIFHALYQKKAATVYQVVTSNDQVGVLFCGVAFNNQDSLLNEYERIVSTMQLK